MLGKKSSRKADEGEAPVLRCSFCNNAQRDVRRLIAGPHVFICDECVQVCVDIIAQDTGLQGNVTGAAPEQVPQARGSEGVAFRSVACALCHTLTPAEDLLWIRERGPLCPGCVSEVEATAAEVRESRPEAGQH